jgi:hypothetical protein
MNSDKAQLCLGCGHERRLHHSYGCDGNLGAQQRFWLTFEDMPGYDLTREAILAEEQLQPPACACTAHTFMG